MNAAERRLIAYAAGAHGLVHAIELTYAALLVRIQLEFGAGDAFMGVIASVAGWSFGATAIPAGFLTDRVGSRRVLYYAFVGATVCCVLVGLAPNEGALTGALALLGLAIGLYHPAGTALIAQGVRQRGLGLGYHGVFGNLGVATAPAIAGGMASLFDWRAGYFLMASLAAAAAVTLRATTLTVQGESEVIIIHDSQAAQGSTLRPGREGINSPLLPLLLVYLAFVLIGFVYRGVITFLPRHIHDQVSSDLGDSLTTVALLTGAAGQYVGGSLSQRVQPERLAVLIVALAVPSLFLAGLLEGGPLLVFAAAFVFFQFAGQPVFNVLVAEYTPAGLIGRSYGISFFANFGLGSAGGAVAGLLVARWDTSAAFLGMACFSSIILLLSLILFTRALRQPPVRLADQPQMMM